MLDEFGHDGKGADASASAFFVDKKPRILWVGSERFAIFV